MLSYARYGTLLYYAVICHPIRCYTLLYAFYSPYYTILFSMPCDATYTMLHLYGARHCRAHATWSSVMEYCSIAWTDILCFWKHGSIMMMMMIIVIMTKTGSRDWCEHTCENENEQQERTPWSGGCRCFRLRWCLRVKKDGGDDGHGQKHTYSATSLVPMCFS